MQQVKWRSLSILADSGPDIGLGHVMRCLAIAEAAASHGISVDFQAPVLPDGIRDRLERSHIDSRQSDISTGPLHAGEAAILDGYRFNESDCRRWRRDRRCLAVIDDNAEKAGFPVDLLINPNIHADRNMYRVWASPPPLLLGSSYAPLRAEFAEREGRQHCRDQADRILLTMGGSDPRKLTSRILSGLAAATRPLHIRVVVGGLAAEAAPPEPGPHKIELHRDVADMAAMMEWADIAVTAAGSTIWELAHLGVPTVAVVVADNQRMIGTLAADRGLILLAEPDTAAQHAVALLDDRPLRDRLSTIGRQTIDGKGAARIVEAIDAVVKGGSPKDVS